MGNSPNSGGKMLFYRIQIEPGESNHSKEGIMGKGDKRTLRRKIFKGSFGNKRPRKKGKAAGAKKEE